MSTPAPEQLVGAVLAGRYYLVRLLGEGGMGAVFEAVDGGRTVAVKVLRPEIAGAEGLARFAREAELTRQVSDPHVIPVLDVGTDPTTHLPYLVMPLLSGADLEQVLADLGRLEPKVAVRVARQACAGLAAAHSVGVVHRDIKLSNLFLDVQPDGDVLVRVVDFGLAKQVDQSSALTKTGLAIGSPLYMSPEQVRDAKRADARSDVYGLANVLYHLVTGCSPWGDPPSLNALFIAICTKDPIPIAHHAPALDPRLSAVIMRGMQREPDDRYASIAAFADALAAFGGGTDRLDAEMFRLPTTALADALGATTSDPSAETRMKTSGGRPPSSDAPARRLIGTVLAGKFPILRVLGQGGMGAVYEVGLPDGGRAAAKVLGADIMGPDEASLRRFLREARAAIAVDDPNVVKIFDIGNDETIGLPFILMEFLRGVDLAELLRYRGPIEPRAAVRLARQAARGLSAAHKKGVVHRDVKPANLFLHSPDGERITVKVCDFGIAKRTQTDGGQASHELTQSGSLLGSPLYMSPEQATSSKTVDHRTDVYSLSATLFEALAGRRLWDGPTSLGEIIVAICTAPIPSLVDVAPWVDPRLAEVVGRGIRRDAAARWPSLDALIEALEPFAGGSDDVSFADLVPIDPARRASVRPPPRPLSIPVAAVGAESLAVHTTDRTSSRRRGWVTAAIVAGALSAAGISAFVATRSQRPAAVAEVRTSAAALEIVPSDAEVEVDGRAVPVVNGAVHLEGVAGDRFEVVVRRAGQTMQTPVHLTKGGTLDPARIVLLADEAPPPVVSSSAGSIAPREPLPPEKAGAHPPRKPIGPASTAVPPTPSVPPPPTPPKPRPQPGVLAPTDKW